MSILPLSQGEIDDHADPLVTRLFTDPDSTVDARESSTSRQEYIARLTDGGFPPSLRRATPAARSRWFDDYLTLCVEHDVADLARIQQKAALATLLARLAAQTGQMLNIASAGEAAGLKARTAENYTKLLEALFLVHRLPAWGRTLRARAVATPKLHVVDPGLAARLLRLTPEKLARRDATALQEFGHLLETFVATEVMQQLSWMDDIAGIGHWRTHDGAEVDLVIEGRDGSIVAIEVKASSRVTTKDLTGLRAIRDALGEAFLTGVVLNTSYPGLPCRGSHPGPTRRPALDHLTLRPPGQRCVTHLEEITMAELSQFHIVFNHEQGALHQDIAVFADAPAALHADDAAERHVAERHFAEEEHIEVVLIGSDSLDTVRRTHANEFDGTAALERLLPAG